MRIPEIAHWLLSVFPYVYVKHIGKKTNKQKKKHAFQGPFSTLYNVKNTEINKFDVGIMFSTLILKMLPYLFHFIKVSFQFYFFYHLD